MDMDGRTWIAGHGWQDTEGRTWLAGHGWQDMDCWTRIAGHGFKHGLQDTDHRTGIQTWIAGHGLQNKDTDMDCTTRIAEGRQHIAGSTSGSRGPAVYKAAQGQENIRLQRDGSTSGSRGPALHQAAEHLLHIR